MFSNKKRKKGKIKIFTEKYRQECATCTRPALEEFLEIYFMQKKNDSTWKV